MKNKIFVILILTIISNYGCKEENKINGHWHIFSEKGFPNDLATLDITDSISIWEKVRYQDWMKSRVDLKNRIIIRPPTEIYTEYQYHLKDDTLVLKDKDGKTILFGIKEEDECNLEKDYFASFMVDINLPIINENLINGKDIYGRSFQLFMGYPKKIAREMYGDSIRLQSHNGLIDLDELDLTNMKHNVKIPKKHQDKINTLIFADKNVMMNKFNELIKKQRSINDRKIVLVGKRKNSSKSMDDLTFMLIEKELDFKKGDNIESWIEREK